MAMTTALDCIGARSVVILTSIRERRSTKFLQARWCLSFNSYIRPLTSLICGMAVCVAPAAPLASVRRALEFVVIAMARDVAGHPEP